ncbi:MAG: putative fatty-acid--CoA ligase/enoyl-CoA hydratase [Ilumatobacteraceae bacterium]|nr:putative fatty-acid--CoA ligase/enoyl-CoA hydratase [Ilumatobacteraceae bacterium]
MSEEFETIEYEVDDLHVATITLDRPDKLNSFNRTMAAEMNVAWGRVRDDDQVHAVVLRANGERAFCTGIDIVEGAWWGDQNIWNHEDPGASLGPRHHRVWKPVVAAVHGMCAGGGMYFVNECDIVLCADNATFFDPHANGGIVSALEPIGMLHRGVPLGEVLRWALMGNDERITAETALRIGLVTEVVPVDDLRARANEIATSIAARRPEAIQGTIRAIWESLDMSRSIALQNGLSYTHIGNPRRDARAEVRQANRKPTFR